MTRFKSPRLPLPPPLMMSEAGSFAHYTMMSRWPTIARRVIAENSFPKTIVENLETLVQELPNGSIRFLTDTSSLDAPLWAKYIEPFLGQRWIDVPWFFAETYFYRRILEAIDYFFPGQWQGTDPFASQKCLGLETELDYIRTFSQQFYAKKQANLHQETQEFTAQLISLLYLDLWGNRADLSLVPFEAIGTRSHIKIFHDSAYILADNTAEVAKLIKDSQPVRIDFIADNAGFELVSDLFLVDFLLATQAVNQVHLHLKYHPTFVSDATIKDVHNTLEFFAADEVIEVKSLAKRLQNYIDSGNLCLQSDLFWTSPLAFWQMPDLLCQELAKSSLVLIKGDANYRRLLGDLQWAIATPFADIVCYFPAPMVALRTLKSEIAAGLMPDRAEAAARQDPEWMTNGQWGVIQFFGNAFK